MTGSSATEPRFAVEIGGTFTDVMWIEGSGKLTTHKTPSTPHDPAEAVLNALREIGAEEHKGELTGFFHGSTVATNAVLTRRGAKAGLIVTQGFRDVLALQRQLRGDVYQLSPKKPEPIIPASMIRQVKERLAPDGSVLDELDEAEAIRVIDELVAVGAEAIAICLLHSYGNPEHEQRLGALIAERHPNIPVSLSSDVLPVFREYERMSATAICSYVLPGVGAYLGRLERHFAEADTPMLIMQSSGGLLPTEGITKRPLEMLESGPAAGVTAALSVGRSHNHGDIITLDMGGTSTDVCLIADGKADQSSERELDGLPIGLPALNIINVGAGGGSLGHFDTGGMLQVGPQSAGATPGPACYDKGGTQPTITDAFAQLGYIRPEAFLGGRMPLNLDAAGEALDQLRSPSDSRDSVAWAIVQIAVANMSRGVGQVSVQRGRDPRAHVLYAFGGMGPVVGALVADELKMDKVVVPMHPGLFSAFGLLLADVTRTYEQTRIVPLHGGDVSGLLDVFADIEQQGIDEFAGYGHDAEELRFDHVLMMRYEGQGFEIAVEVDLDRIRSEGTKYLFDLFRAEHIRQYGTAAPSDLIEAVTVRVVTVLERGGVERAPQEPTMEGVPEPTVLPVSFAGETRDCTFVSRAGLQPGSVHEGLMVVEEPTTTTIVPPGWRCRVESDRVLILERVSK